MLIDTDKIKLEQFQWGKLDIPEDTKFQITAFSSGVNVNLYRDIPYTFSLHLNNREIERFELGYGCLPHHSSQSYLLGKFTKSPSVEHSKRPYYFIQHHYIIIPYKIAEKFNYDFGNFFGLFANGNDKEIIARYSKLYDNMDSVIASSESLIFEKNRKNVIYLQSLFKNGHAIFFSENKSPLEKVMFLADVVSHLPQQYRLSTPYITTYGHDEYFIKSPFKLTFRDILSNNILDIDVTSDVLVTSGELMNAYYPYIKYIRNGLNADDPMFNKNFISSYERLNLIAEYLMKVKEGLFSSDDAVRYIDFIEVQNIPSNLSWLVWLKDSKYHQLYKLMAYILNSNKELDNNCVRDSTVDISKVQEEIKQLIAEGNNILEPQIEVVNVFVEMISCDTQSILIPLQSLLHIITNYVKKKSENYDVIKKVNLSLTKRPSKDKKNIEEWIKMLQYLFIDLLKENKNISNDSNGIGSLSQEYLDLVANSLVLQVVIQNKLQSKIFFLDKIINLRYEELMKKFILESIPYVVNVNYNNNLEHLINSIRDAGKKYDVKRYDVDIEYVLDSIRKIFN